jgi:hypothetical protein
VARHAAAGWTEGLTIMRKRFALAALSAVAGLGAVVGLAGTAGATESTGYIKHHTTSFTSPSTVSTAVHHNLTPETPVNTKCFREGQVRNGNPYWFLIEKNGDLGYVHVDAISAPKDTPHC